MGDGALLARHLDAHGLELREILRSRDLRQKLGLKGFEFGRPAHGNNPFVADGPAAKGRRPENVIPGVARPARPGQEAKPEKT